ncbi:MAG: hypothetical protein ABEI86_00655, partial [Halobacteriaceae archaeon]
MENRDKYLVSLSLLFFVLFILVLRLIPTTYNISIYAQVPSLLLFVGLGLVIVSVTRTIFGLYYHKTNNSWRAAPFLIVLTATLLLPYLLGYQIRYGDPMIKAGNIRDILTGSGLMVGVTGLDKYPHLHFLISELSLVTGHRPSTLMMFTIAIFVIVYAVSLVAIGRYHSLPPSAVLIFLPLAFHSSFRPMTPSASAYLSSFILLLLLLEMLYNAAGQSKRFYLIFLILNSALWVQHLFIGLLFLGSIVVSGLLYYARQDIEKTPLKQSLGIFYLSSAFLGIVWMLYLQRWLFEKAVTLGLSFIGLFELSGQPNSPIPGGGLSYLTEVLGCSFLDISVLAFKRFGGLLVVFSVAFLGLVIYLDRQRVEDKEKSYLIPIVL